jgi:hypothetical protein
MLKKSALESISKPNTPFQVISLSIATLLTCRGLRRLLQIPSKLSKAVILEKVVMKLATHFKL